jgi:hypothetical protein
MYAEHGWTAPDSRYRARTLAALGASPAEVDELLAYTENHFHPEQLPAPLSLPLEPEPHVEVWREYAEMVGTSGSIDPLREVFVQLRFPIRAGLSDEDTYRAATRRGEIPDVQPDAIANRAPIEVVIHDHPAGPVPAIITHDRADFVALVRAFTARNEPAAIPDSQGAAVVAGYNNWDRIRRAGGSWQGLEKSAYQDRFLLISDGPYSGVPAAQVELTDEDWRARSVALRLEHEAAHYFTRRVFQSMKNQVHDELIADWAGIRAAAGRYRADWFFQFVGLEAYPSYREGGRLQNYRSSPAPLSDGAFRVLQTLTHRAATTVERFENARGVENGSRRALAVGLIRLAMVGVDELASDEGMARLDEAHRTAEASVRLN